MHIFIQKRHVFFLGLVIFGMILVVKNYKVAGSIMRARDISEYRGNYVSGDYVMVYFDDVLYMKYEGPYGGVYKRYDVYGTPDSFVYYVNGLGTKYILLEITNEKIIEAIDRGEVGKQEMLGIVYTGSFDVEEFLACTDGKADVDKKIVVRQVEHPDIFMKRMLLGLALTGLGIVLFYMNGGMASMVRRKVE